VTIAEKQDLWSSRKRWKGGAKTTSSKEKRETSREIELCGWSGNREEIEKKNEEIRLLKTKAQDRGSLTGGCVGRGHRRRRVQPAKVIWGSIRKILVHEY